VIGDFSGAENDPVKFEIEIGKVIGALARTRGAGSDADAVPPPTA
jgi:hypothetical protein